eukprot:5354455-Amphidinium_carterae.2
MRRIPGLSPAWSTAAVALPNREGCVGPSTWCRGNDGHHTRCLTKSWQWLWQGSNRTCNLPLAWHQWPLEWRPGCRVIGPDLDLLTTSPPPSDVGGGVQKLPWLMCPGKGRVREGPGWRASPSLSPASRLTRGQLSESTSMSVGVYIGSSEPESGMVPEGGVGQSGNSSVGMRAVRGR